MRLAQVAVHSPEALGLAGIAAGLLLFLAGYVVGALPQSSATLDAAGNCPATAQGAAAARTEFEPLALDGHERKVKTIVIPTPAN